MSIHIEIEKTFLVDELPDQFAELPHVEIAQGYLAFDKGGVEVRLRKVDEARFLTLKTQHDDMRVEREITLTDDQFEELWLTWRALNRATLHALDAHIAQYLATLLRPHVVSAISLNAFGRPPYP